MIWMSCNCGRGIFAIVFYNSNAIIDDNWDVYLNGTKIGSIDNNQDKVTGRIFSADATEPTPADIGSPISASVGWPGSNQMQSTIQLPAGLLVNGVNHIKLVITQDNNHGDFGGLCIGYWALNATTNKYDFDTGTALLNISYDDVLLYATGPGKPFNYP